jgi:hypothetical protein
VTHKFSFFRVGGVNQVKIETGADLLNLDQLDQKLWVALACPTQGVEFDNRTLSLIDLDGDGRIRASELITAIKWAGGLLKDPEELIRKPDSLSLSMINVDTEEGKKVLHAAKTALTGLGKTDASAISVVETGNALTAFHALPFNGDGVITIASADSDDDKALITDIVATLGGLPDCSGNTGVNTDKVTEFAKAVADYLTWFNQQPTETKLSDPSAAVAAVNAVSGKIDDYFVRCRLAAFDARAVAALNREEKDYIAMAAKDLVLGTEEIRGLPLAQITDTATLPLEKGLNPAWQAAMATFIQIAVTPLLGIKQNISEVDWQTIRTTIGNHDTWQAAKTGGQVESLGIERLRSLASQDLPQRLAPLFVKEEAEAGTATGIAAVEKLARYVRDLANLAVNFVNFKEFYERKNPAIFQAGKLYLDQRTAELCMRVDDAGKHATMAPLSSAYLAYCDCVRKVDGAKMTIAAAFTNGDSDNLMVGRNGVFYSRDGRDWDATITKLVENPISLRQAFWSPYKKFVRFIEEQVAKRAAAGDTASSSMLTSSAEKLGTAAQTGDAAAVAPKKFDIGVVAALGVAVGGITAALGGLLDAFFGLGFWMPLGLIGLILVISGPSMVIAWLKLRQRNLGPLLDANGWAVNAKARINVPFGASLTSIATLPKGSNLDLVDPFAEKSTPWGTYILLLLIAAGAAWWYIHYR